jgi:hypothetical protein
MKLSQLIPANAIQKWSETALDDTNPETVSLIIDRASDPNLVGIAEALADSSVTKEQVLGVLVGLDLFLDTRYPKLVH